MAAASASSTGAAPFEILIFSRTAAYRHASIPAGIRALQQLAARSGSFAAVAGEDASVFTRAGGLAAYRVIVLLQCSGAFLDGAALGALKAFVRSGRGVVGIHSASFAFTLPSDDPWYGRLVGGVFANHPAPQLARLTVPDPAHPIIAVSLGKGGGMRRRRRRRRQQQQQQSWLDEWYNFKTHPRLAAGGGLHVLLAVDEQSYSGGTHGQDHPVAWCQEFDGGRSFYTSLGHFDEAYEDEAFMSQLLGGILWTARVS
ncbi:ThuA-like domain-containing protein [Lasiosphaeria miniovina]|uniref:ThuA-like domain-containing protein n=1 Tax=Lasiosphaeria miniovina TaxID=1954250 RepID=A0AA40B6U8_9PEZI|nr:ThuA-like domain-containing protein [Lasiosphaeria miniovina]KAK0728757.1 ThuA-like domain-containing protein [Lasiosphaeria miniovina]